MGNNLKSTRSFIQSRSCKLGLSLPVGFILFSLIILLQKSKTIVLPYVNSSLQLSLITTNTTVSSSSESMDMPQADAVAFDDPKPGLREIHENPSLKQSTSIVDISNMACDRSSPRSDICEMEGDIRVHGKSSTIVLVAPPPTKSSEMNEPFKIKPYARKGDSTALRWVKEIILKSSTDHEQAHQCTINHTKPAIVFSTGGYAGNLFHAFTDVLIPLFLTSVEYRREVHFLVSGKREVWINKHRKVLDELSRYETIDLDKDDETHCFPRAIVGLRSHKEFNIDPKRLPVGYSMPNFTQFIRRAYSLKRETAIKIGRKREPGKRPRLLLIARKSTRSFTNIDRIIKMAEKLGYNVVIAEANATTNATGFARAVNSCDVMVGIHGAGLSNFVFLPTNAVLIQIVPWGRFEWIARYDFGWPASDSKLRYLQYEIRLEESSLKDEYPSDHPIIKDPMSVHKQGWAVMRSAFFKQNVRLDLKRFKPVLLKALKHLHQ